MAFRYPINISRPDTNTFLDRIGNQSSFGASPSHGDGLCYVLSSGTDRGVYCTWDVPESFVNTPVLVIKGILDGAPGAAHTLGFGVQLKALGDNESANVSLDAELAASKIIGSDGHNYSDKDWFTLEITLNEVFAAGDDVFAWLYRDQSATTYTGNFLLAHIDFKFNET